ncbi:MAG: NAD(P)H-hydrate dehydratase [Anaerolineae bacterium]
MRILSVSEIQTLESEADAAGHTYGKMMALAGLGLANAIRQQILSGTTRGRRILVLVGPGNNGGDGLVAARHLEAAGAEVTAYLSREREAEADPVYRKAKEQGVRMLVARSDRNGETLRRLVAQADVIVDALLGTGATPPIRGTIANVLETVHEILNTPPDRTLTRVRRVPPAPEEHPKIVAVDGPSGLDFDTGEVDDLALKAHLTVTFAMPKWGHFQLPGAAYVGDLLVADIGLPDSLAIPEGPELATPDLIRDWLPPRPLDAHKGTFGKAMVAAGSTNYTGAAILAATAAVRAGTGLVTLAIPAVLHTAVVSSAPEVTYVLLPHSLGVLNEHATPVLLKHVDGYSALLVGPGLGRTSETHDFLESLLNPHDRRRSTGFIKGDTEEGVGDENVPQDLPPLIIDADGLNLLSEIPDWPDHLPAGTVLTPHPGEMARLIDSTPSEIQANRLATAQTWADEWQQVIVLKGAFTVVAGPNRQPVVLPFANSALSTAGTGDVLAGAIVAMRAQGLDAFEAAVTGAFLHGLAGEIVSVDIGEAGTAAGDVSTALAEAWRRLAHAR